MNLESTPGFHDMDRYTVDFLYGNFSPHVSFEENDQFLFTQKEWEGRQISTLKLALLGIVLFSRVSGYVDLMLIEFQTEMDSGIQSYLV